MRWGSRSHWQSKDPHVTPQDKAQADELVQRINQQAASYLLDPDAGHRARYRPWPTVIRDDSLLSVGTGPRIDSQVLLSDWLEAIASKDLTGWRWKIDRSVMPNELLITERRR
jgi:hypothetical protein